MQQELNKKLIELLNARKTYSSKKSDLLHSISTNTFGRVESYIQHKLKMHGRNNVIAAIEKLNAITIVKAVPEFRGIFEMFAKSNLALMVLENSYENTLIPFIENILMNGGDVIDIGANVGFYTNLSSKLIGAHGKVLAIEPNPFVFSLLESNTKRNKLDNAILYNGVATAETGIYALNATEGCPEYSSLGTIIHPHAPKEIKKISVQGETIDNLVSEYKLSPILLKIDVEGAEGIVLSGAQKILKKYKPYILSELDDRLLKQ